jgi:hypothetical protein
MCVDLLFHGDDGALGGQYRFLLHARDAPQQDIAFAVGFLGVDDCDVGTYRGDGGKLLAGKRALDGAYLRVEAGKMGARIPAHHGKGKIGRARDIGVGEIGVAALGDRERRRTVMLNGVAGDDAASRRPGLPPRENVSLRAQPAPINWS